MPATRLGSSERLLDELRGWVERETPTTDAAAVDSLTDVAEAELRAAGALVERVPGTGGYGDCLVARTPGDAVARPRDGLDARPRDDGAGRAPVVVAGHLDTVWDHGTLAGMPFRVEGDRAHGPGIYDMKAGSFLALHCVREILRQGTPTRRPVTLLLTSDEEVGSPSSRALIERHAAGAAAVLIPEPAGVGGACVTARKGVGRFVVRVAGRASHAGGHWGEGRSAVVALAALIGEIHALVDEARGVTTNVAPVWGGTRPNVIPDAAGCEVDLRVASAADGERLAATVLALAGPRGDGVTVTVTGGMNRPPFAETAAIRALHARAAALAAEAGFALPASHRGGGSDGNFSAHLGVPTLDGLGCTGAGAHAPHEHILWRDLAPRAAVLCGLLETID